MFVGPCAPCPAARDAMAHGFLLWNHRLEAYVRTDIPWRRPAEMARARKTWAPVSPYETTQPYTWTCCPWCGGDLAPPVEGEG